MPITYLLLAAVYGENTYGSGEYNSTAATGADNGGVTGGNTPSGTVQPSGPGQPSGGLLADTGFDLVLGLTLGSVIIFSALVIRFWRRPAQE